MPPPGPVSAWERVIQLFPERECLIHPWGGGGGRCLPRKCLFPTLWVLGPSHLTSVPFSLDLTTQPQISPLIVEEGA